MTRSADMAKAADDVLAHLHENRMGHLQVCGQSDRPGAGILPPLSLPADGVGSDAFHKVHAGAQVMAQGSPHTLLSEREGDRGRQGFTHHAP